MPEKGRYYWFTVGYLACIAVEILSGYLFRLMGDLLSDEVTVAVVSENGSAATIRDESIAAESVARISEYTETEKGKTDE